MGKQLAACEHFRKGDTTVPADTLEAMLRDALSRPEPGTVPGGIIIDQFPAIIHGSGPSSEADWTDARYWVKSSHVSNTSGGSTSLPTLADDAAPRFRHVTATNLPELAAGTHSLAVGTYVWVVKTRDRSSPPVERYFFTCKPSVVRWHQIPLANGVLVSDGTWASGYGIGQQYDDGALISQAELYVAFALDEDGLSVGRTLDDWVSLAFMHWTEMLTENNLTTDRTTYFQVQGIYEAFTPSTLTWATRPATAANWSEILNYCHCDYGGKYYGSYPAMFGMHQTYGDPAPPCYGLRLYMFPSSVQASGTQKLWAGSEYSRPIYLEHKLTVTDP